MNRKKRHWLVGSICLILLIFVIGIFCVYYNKNTGETISEGTLIVETGMGRLWR